MTTETTQETTADAESLGDDADELRADTEDELRVLIEGAATILSENGFNVEDTAVESFSEELWAFIWLAGEGDELSDPRQEAAVSLLETHVKNTNTDLPTTVNMNYEKAGDSAVAIYI